MHPVPGYPITTPYGRRGPYWSCDEDGNGNGIHTGADIAAPAGALVIAARPGTVVHSNHGAAFGSHQVDVVVGDGTRDFYAHMSSRVAHGVRLEAGAKVGEVGTEGNVTGAHLHFERHATETGGWSCAVVRDPAPSLNYQPSADSGASGEEPTVPKFSRMRKTTAQRVEPETWTNVVYDTQSAGDAGKAGEAWVVLGASPFVVTLNAIVMPNNPLDEVVRTRFIERQAKGDGWQTSEEYPAAEHRVTGGNTYLVDSRAQRVPADTRLVAQVNLKSGGTIKSAELCALYF